MIDTRVYYQIGEILNNVFNPSENTLVGEVVPIGDALNLIYDHNASALRVNLIGDFPQITSIDSYGETSNTIFSVAVADAGVFNNRTIVEKGYIIEKLNFKMDITSLSTNNFFNFTNLKINSTPLVLDLNDSTLTIDTLTQNISQTDIGTGFTIDINYGDLGQFTDSKTTTIDFGQKTFFGYLENDILIANDFNNLLSTPLKTNLNTSISCEYTNNNTANYMWFCYPFAWGDLKKLDSSSGDLSSLSDWVKIGSVNIENSNEISENYTCYRTTYKNSSNNLIITFN